ncbi:S8 family serine peptidase, partial [Reinekea blandensis]
MKPLRINLKRLPARVALIAVTVGAVSLATPSFASNVTEKSNTAERPKIEKTLTPSAAPQMMMRSFAIEPRERYIVGLVDESVARYRGGVDGYAATSTEGQSKLDVRSSEARAYSGYLATTQEKFLQQMSRELGRDVTVVDQFQVATNAMIVELTKAEAAKVAQIDGLRSIVKDQLFKLEKTETLDGFAIPVDKNTTQVWTITAFALLALTLLALVAYRRGWLNRNSAVFAMLATTLGMAGCYYEGGFQWIGAPQIWTGSHDLEPTRGEGIVVGIIDTGINPISDSFAEVAGDGYRHTNPKGQYFGVCDERSDVFDPNFPCNDKLIGAWGVPYIDEGSARDIDGHGSHTGGTSAGNLVYDATVTAPTGFEVTKTIAGVSPRSNVISYKVCGADGCYLAAILFAIEQAIVDGVDVINYSIGGGSSDPWADYDALSFLSAMDAGIFVATSAGNSGPDFATLGSPADSPWITAVAASSHNYFYKNSLVSLVGDDGQTYPDIIGQSIAPGFESAPIVDAADYGNAQCLEGEFTSAFNGEIVLCDAGTIARVAKGANVQANGGGALILARPPTSPDGSGYLEADTHVIPATHITYTDAEQLREWMAASGGLSGSLSGTETVLADDYADVLAYFSSRGVNPSVPSVVKPNITAPGRAIFAAYYEDYSEAEQDYNIIQGTSMSSPHIAGAGALLKSLHPDWTPMQIQSAMMTTADLNHTKEDGVTQADAFDVGAGRIDLPAAARAALVLDETQANFLAADPFFGGNPAALNLTGLGDVACVVTCSWTRVATNVSDKTTRWKSLSTDNVTVTPKHFALAPGESVELTFVASAASVDVGEWLFDQVPVRSKTRGVPDVHFPVAALSALSNLPAAIDITAAQEADTVTLSDLQTIEITDASVQLTGLAPS